MKIIILAAGQGKRLRPLTDTIPKCMVKFKGKPIIDYIISAIHLAGIEDIVIVSGYKNEVLKKHLRSRNVKFIVNNEYENTNMVYSLFKAEDDINDDVIITYSDIIYHSSVLKKLINFQSPLSIVIDKNWEKLWKIRMENPLEDAETLKINNKGNIIEIGNKPTNISDIEGQYIGLIKVKKNNTTQFKTIYHELRKSQYKNQQKKFNNMYMTSFIQHIIDTFNNVKPCYINNGWLEIDSISDLNAYKKSDFLSF